MWLKSSKKSGREYLIVKNKELITLGNCYLIKTKILSNFLEEHIGI